MSTGKDNDKKTVVNFFTLDIEEWFHANYDAVGQHKYDHLPSTLPNLVDILIEEMQKKNVMSTCFVVGEVGKKHPLIVKKLHAAGHEIATHSLHHKLVYQMKPKEFESDVKESCDILEHITGTKVRGFRAPSWSIKRNNLPWYYNALEKCKLEYSSSVFPAENYLYGINTTNTSIHITKEYSSNIVEIPCSVHSFFGARYGFSGGFYLRAIPYWYIYLLTKIHNKKDHVVFYLHPREIDLHQERLDLPFTENLIHYWNIKATLPKIRKILRDFGTSCKRMDEYVAEFKMRNCKS